MRHSQQPSGSAWGDGHDARTAASGTVGSDTAAAQHALVTHTVAASRSAEWRSASFSRPIARPAGERRWDWLGDRWLLGALAALALAIRLPYLWEIPRFTDELQEVLWALAIFRGEIHPLTAVDSYYGPLWSYLLAGAFSAASVAHLDATFELLPRLVAMLLAVATVVVTYLVGRDLAGRRAGLIAAALLATAGGHVIINSHTARSNSITPLLTTVVVWLLFRAARSGDGRWLVGAGFVFGLALQTHLSVIALIPGLVLGLALLRPRLLVSPWILGGAAGFLVGYANMVIYNLESGFWSFIHARALQQGYTDGRSTDLTVYLTNLSALVESLGRLLSGTIDEAGNPTTVLYLGLAVVGLVLLARRGNPLPLAICLSIALVLPYFNPRYGPILSGRYLIPMLPFAFLGVALALDALVRWLPDLGGLRPRRPETRSALAGLLACVLIVFPLAPLTLYYREVLGDARTNRPLFSLSDAVASAYRSEDRVLLDEALGKENLTAGGTDLKAMRVLLEADQIPYEVAKLNRQGVETILETDSVLLVVMDAKKVEDLERLVRIVPMSDEVASASGSERTYGVYRLTPRQARAADTVRDHGGGSSSGGAAR